MKAYPELLCRIGELCGGGYTVVEAAELAPEMPRADLEEAVSALASEGLVSLSYAEDGVWCLALTEAGKGALLCPEPHKERKRGGGRVVLFALAAFLGGFAGAALGVLLLGGAA